ncbi:MAG: hypothetical protein IT449_10240 [Phycisphaerales bacterium]|nr:hypothetical protein [Phycisphaerales bacterium]
MISRWSVVACLLTAKTLLAQVNLPPGFEVVEIAENDYGSTNADINDCGQIAFGQRQDLNGHIEVFVYDNGYITQITNGDDRNVIPQINNSGQMIWGRGVHRATVTQLIFYDQGVETLVEEYSNAPNGWSINNLGHVCWARKVSSRCPRQENLFLWDGSTANQQTFDAELSNVGPSLNDLDAFAWTYAQFCDNPWRSEVLVRFADKVLTLPSPGTQNQTPELTNSGLVVWTSSSRLLLWTGLESRELLERGGRGSLNEWPRVYVPVFDFSTNSWPAWILDVRDKDIARYLMTDNDFWYSNGSVNKWGEAAADWSEDPPNSQWRGGVLFLRRIRTGDSEFDGDVDLRDHNRFAQVMTGSVRKDRLCEDRFLDIDYDGDLDLGDYAKFQNAFTGASP